jgi:membrane protein CcdC involved in cytochrome C biogenesis
MKMWIALGSIGLMFIAVTLINISRFKVNGVIKYVLATIAWASMIIAGLLIILVVFSGPVKD